MRIDLYKTQCYENQLFLRSFEPLTPYKGWLQFIGIFFYEERFSGVMLYIVNRLAKSKWAQSSKTGSEQAKKPQNTRRNVVSDIQHCGFIIVAWARFASPTYARMELNWSDFHRTSLNFKNLCDLPLLLIKILGGYNKHSISFSII